MLGFKDRTRADMAEPHSPKGQDRDKPHLRYYRKRALKPLPIRSLVPNAITVLALCAGLTSIRFALEGRFEIAVGAILFASILDGLDGRIARLLKGTTKFGAELDSLTDFVNFGVAPVMMLYLWTLSDLGGIGWIAVLGFAVCCALRLARFNVGTEDPDKPVWASNYFVGVPAPAGAGLVMLPLYLSFHGALDAQAVPFLVALYTGLIAFLMVSRVPTFSGKRLGVRISRDKVLPVLLMVALFAALLVSYPWATLAGFCLLYAGSLPIGALRYRYLKTRSAPVPEDGNFPL